MRGKDLGGSNFTSISRITPAYAGKSAPQLGQYWNA